MTEPARIAILISGRGSNMTALLTAMADPAYPAKPCLVLSDNADADGLGAAMMRGVEAASVDRATFSDRAAFDEEIDARLRRAAADYVCLAGFMRVLGLGLRRDLAGQNPQHPPLAPAELSLAFSPMSGPLKRACGSMAARCTFVTPEVDSGPDCRPGRRAGRP